MGNKNSEAVKHISYFVLRIFLCNHTLRNTHYAIRNTVRTITEKVVLQ